MSTYNKPFMLPSSASDVPGVIGFHNGNLTTDGRLAGIVYDISNDRMDFHLNQSDSVCTFAGSTGVNFKKSTTFASDVTVQSMTVTGSLSAGTLSFGDISATDITAVDITAHNLTLSGDLVVNGISTIIDTTTLEVQDNVIVVNANPSAEDIDSGIVTQRHYSKFTAAQTTGIGVTAIAGSVVTVDNVTNLNTNDLLVIVASSDQPELIGHQRRVLSNDGFDVTVESAFPSVTDVATITLNLYGEQTNRFAGLLHTTSGVWQLGDTAKALSNASDITVTNHNSLVLGNLYNGGTNMAVSCSDGNLTLSTTTTGNVVVSGVDNVDIDAGATGDVTIDGGQVVLASKQNVANAITLTTNVGTSETIVLTNTQGTSNSAIAITATAGGVDIDAAANNRVNIDGGQIILQSKGNLNDAIALDTNVGTTETIRIINHQGTNTSAVVMNAEAGGVEISGASTVNLICSDGAVAVNAPSFDVNVTSDVTMDAAQSISLDAGAASNFTTTAGALTLDGNGGVNIEGNAAEVDITTTGAVDINSGAFTVDATTLSLDSTNDTNLTMTASDAGTKTLSISASNSGNGVGVIDINADGNVTIDSSEAGVSIDGVTASNMTVTGLGHSLTLAAAGGGAQSVVISSAGTGADAVDINATAGGVDVNANGAIALVAGVASNFTTSDGALTLNGNGGVNVVGNDAEVDITTTGAVDINSGAFTLDGSSVGITSTGTTATAIDINVTGAGGGLDIDVNATGSFTVGNTLVDFISAAPGGFDILAPATVPLTISSSDQLTIASAETISVTATSDITLTHDSTSLTIGQSDATFNCEVNGIGFITTSDKRYKKNIKTYNNALDDVCKLRGCTFKWRSNEYTGYNWRQGTDVGFIAQEVEQVVPSVVYTNSLGYKAVSYDRITAILVEAIKEQNNEINMLKTQLGMPTRVIEPIIDVEIEIEQPQYSKNCRRTAALRKRLLRRNRRNGVTEETIN